MAVPKKKKTRSKSSIRRGPLALSKPNLVRCKNCKGLKKPHLACPHCES